MKQKFYITFGLGTILGTYYLVLEAETNTAARLKIIELMKGNHIWAGCYTEAEFGNNPHGLTRLEVPDHIIEITDWEEEQAKERVRR